MNIKHTLLVFLLICSPFLMPTLKAQKPVFGIPHSNRIHAKNIQQFYFQDLSFLLLSEVYRSLPDVHYIQKRPYVTSEMLGNSGVPSIGWGINGMRINQRLNLIEYNDIASLSLAVPVQISFCLYGLTFFAPVFLQTNFFRHSTKTELDNYGFNLGIGYGRIRGIAIIEEAREYFENVTSDKGIFLLNSGFTFKSGATNKSQRIDYWIGLAPKYITHAGDNRYLANFYFSIAYSSRFILR